MTFEFFFTTMAASANKGFGFAELMKPLDLALVALEAASYWSEAGLDRQPSSGSTGSCEAAI